MLQTDEGGGPKSVASQGALCKPAKHVAITSAPTFETRSLHSLQVISVEQKSAHALTRVILRMPRQLSNI